MKELKQILDQVNPINVIGDINTVVNGLKLDCGKVETGDVFFAVKGTTVDGHSFIPKVIEQGAGVIVCEAIPEVTHNDVVYIQVKDARRTSAIMACNFYDHPSL